MCEHRSSERDAEEASDEIIRTSLLYRSGKCPNIQNLLINFSCVRPVDVVRNCSGDACLLFLFVQVFYFCFGSFKMFAQLLARRLEWVRNEDKRRAKKGLRLARKGAHET